MSFLNLCYNPTKDAIPVYEYGVSRYTGPWVDTQKGPIGYLQPGEQFAFLDFVGHPVSGNWAQIGFYNHAAQSWKSSRGYTTYAAINSIEAINSDAFGHNKSLGMHSGNPGGVRRSYRTFTVRNQCYVWQRVNDSLYLTEILLSPGDTVGVMNGTSWNKNYPALDASGCSGRYPWFLEIDTYTKAHDPYEPGIFPWQDQQGVNNKYFVDLGHLQGRTMANNCNIITLTNGYGSGR